MGNTGILQNGSVGESKAIPMKILKMQKRVHPGKENCLNGALYKQAGNSIPVPIFESLFRKVILGETEKIEEQTGQLRFA